MIRANRAAGMPDTQDLPKLVAHLLHDLDEFMGRA
jgi:hypothetical protein